ncbi:hypothetical protein EC12741_0914 [Escherichia coli 1.2741]|nr:hypothetical protein EC12741_0914 [Escherichia coli 1.2741]
MVIDLWSCAVIGWSMSPRMTAQLACDALQMALWRRQRNTFRFFIACLMTLFSDSIALVM